MTAEKKDRKPLQIKNLADLKLMNNIEEESSTATKPDSSEFLL